MCGRERPHPPLPQPPLSPLELWWSVWTRGWIHKAPVKYCFLTIAYCKQTILGLHFNFFKFVNLVLGLSQEDYPLFFFLFLFLFMFFFRLLGKESAFPDHSLHSPCRGPEGVRNKGSWLKRSHSLYPSCSASHIGQRNKQCPKMRFHKAFSVQPRVCAFE